MNRFAILAAGLILVAGCRDITPPQEAEPPPVRADVTPQDVEDMIGDSYAAYWGVAHYWRSNGIAMDIMSNHNSSSWGNYGMRDVGNEPRQPLSDLNQTSYLYAYIFEVPWDDNYRAIADASEGLNALKAGVELGPGGQDNARAEAFAKFVQGVAGCDLSLIFEKAALVDEKTPPQAAAKKPPVPNRVVRQFYLNKLADVHRLSMRNPFTLPSHWINGNPLSNDQLAALARNYMARCAANGARSPQENRSAGWGQIQNWLDEGRSFRDLIIDGNPVGDDAWWDGIKTLGGSEMTTWQRAHMDWVGMSDQSGNYQAWLNTPLQSRTPMTVATPDLRLPRTAVDGDRGVYHTFNENIIFIPARGTYRQSHYGDHRWEDYVNSCSFCYFGPIPEMLSVEMDLIEAEGYVERGMNAAAAAVLNGTRVGNGGLSPLTGGGTVPTEPGGECVPRKRFDPAGTCGNLRDALIWEHMMEIFQLSGGLTYFFLRGQGMLPAGTSVDWPIPARVQESMSNGTSLFAGAGEAEPTLPAAPANWAEATERLRRWLDHPVRRPAESPKTPVIR